MFIHRDWLIVSYEPGALWCLAAHEREYHRRTLQSSRAPWPVFGPERHWCALLGWRSGVWVSRGRPAPSLAVHVSYFLQQINRDNNINYTDNYISCKQAKQTLSPIYRLLHPAAILYHLVALTNCTHLPSVDSVQLTEMLENI